MRSFEFPVFVLSQTREVYLNFLGGLKIFPTITTQIMLSAFCEVSLTVTWVYMVFFFIIISVQCVVKIMETHVSYWDVLWSL